MQALEATERTCRECGGSGRVKQKRHRGAGRRSVSCYACRGTGKVAADYSTK